MCRRGYERYGRQRDQKQTKIGNRIISSRQISCWICSGFVKRTKICINVCRMESCNFSAIIPLSGHHIPSSTGRSETRRTRFLPKPINIIPNSSLRSASTRTPVQTRCAIIGWLHRALGQLRLSRELLPEGSLGLTPFFYLLPRDIGPDQASTIGHLRFRRVEPNAIAMSTQFWQGQHPLDVSVFAAADYGVVLHPTQGVVQVLAQQSCKAAFGVDAQSSKEGLGYQLPATFSITTILHVALGQHSLQHRH